MYPQKPPLVTISHNISCREGEQPTLTMIELAIFGSLSLKHETMDAMFLMQYALLGPTTNYQRK